MVTLARAFRSTDSLSSATMSAHAKQKTVFRRIESILKDKFPSDIEKILIASGYDSPSIVSVITESTISAIEEHINNDFNILQGTSYDSTKENFIFKLKPGHKEFILNLPKILKQSDEKKQKSVTKEKKNEENSLESLNVDSLKEILVKKVANFLKRQSYETILNITDVGDFHYSGNKIKTKIVCPFCESNIIVDYRSYWNISNLQKHFKIHFKNTAQNFTVTSAITDTATNIDIVDIPIRCVSGSQENLLDEILAA